MLISALELKNFGIYKGVHALELAPHKKYQNSCPVVLIGGKNGAGKSTLFEAIKLCLYGMKSLDEKASKTIYHSYLKSRINWFAKTKQASVKLTFNIFRESLDLKEAKEYEYKILRQWSLSGQEIKEDLLVYQNGLLLDIDSSFWQDFIEEIIPQGVVDLFFFDGEKIQALAEGSSQNLESSIKSLLNLSIIPSLSTDLQMLYKKHLKDSDKNHNAKESKDNFKKLAILEKEIEMSKSSCASLDGKIHITNSKIRNLEVKLKKEGGQYYEKRDKLKDQQKASHQMLETIRKTISKMCEDHIPFMLAPHLAKKVLGQLKKDIKILEGQFVKDILSQKREELNKNVKLIAKDLKLKKDIARSLLDRMSGYTSGWLTGFSTQKVKYGLDPTPTVQSLNILNKTKDQKQELFDLFKRAEKLSRDSKKLEIQLEQTLESDFVVQIHKEINQQNQILGSQEKDLDICQKKLSQQEIAHKALLKKINNENKKISSSKIEKNCYDRIAPIRQVLIEFEKRLTQDKLFKLETEIYNCYAQICRKSGFIKNVKIDPSTFEVTMFEKHQKIIPVDQLSAGEKQVYAISVLWALSKMSGRPLPMIIDTPLGRLDVEHRSKLIKNFFSKASHQIVILSTDTEINKVYFDQIKKYVSHSYNIDFNLQRGHSNIKDGYLFSKNRFGNLEFEGDMQ